MTKENVSVKEAFEITVSLLKKTQAELLEARKVIKFYATGNWRPGPGSNTKLIIYNMIDGKDLNSIEKVGDLYYVKVGGKRAQRYLKDNPS